MVKKKWLKSLGKVDSIIYVTVLYIGLLLSQALFDLPDHLGYFQSGPDSDLIFNLRILVSATPSTGNSIDFCFSKDWLWSAT